MHRNESGPGTRFGGFRYSDERKCLVRDDGTEVRLRPKSLATFRHLATHADRVVDRESLHRVIWGRACVTDDSLGKCIAEIRQAIGDTAHAVLRTVPRHGYLLVSDRSTALEDAAAGYAVSAIARSGSSPDAHRRTANWLRQPLGGLLLLAVVLPLVHQAIKEPTRSVAVTTAPGATGHDPRIPTVSLHIDESTDPAEQASLDRLLPSLYAAAGSGRSIALGDGETDYRLTLALRRPGLGHDHCLAIELADTHGAIVYTDSIPLGDPHPVRYENGQHVAPTAAFWSELFTRTTRCAPRDKAFAGMSALVARTASTRQRERFPFRVASDASTGSRRTSRHVQTSPA